MSFAVSYAGIYEVSFAVSHAGIYEVSFAVSHAGFHEVSQTVSHGLTRTAERRTDCLVPLYSAVRNCTLHCTYIPQNKSVCRHKK